MNLTPFARPLFLHRANRTDLWDSHSVEIQRRVLRSLLRAARDTEYGRRYGFSKATQLKDPYETFRRCVPIVDYEEIRPLVMRMIKGGKGILWPGICRNFAQSSGTSGGKSKYIPVTNQSLRLNHYAGAADVVAHYLRCNPSSRMFSGKGFILGGSFANELNLDGLSAKVGDLSATLIDKVTPPAEVFRIPDKRTALLPDWDVKLPALAKCAVNENVTNISGVPSWFLVVLKKILEISGKTSLMDVWPNLEVFFHGGISFAPYKTEYLRIVDPAKMHFFETYNASEGFFATQSDFIDPSLLMIIDAGIFFEFAPVGHPELQREIPIPIDDVIPGEIYELIISSANGLWRYRLGDTVKVESVNPLKITIAGRTKSFINAFGEELMEANAEIAIARVCDAMGASIKNYTAAPVFVDKGKRGRHEWLIEWANPPADIKKFAETLDRELRNVNSDYDAKRSGDIFLDPLTIVTARKGLFNAWLKSAGTHKLGGQRKVPRLSNNRSIMESMLALNAD
ncbi:MAG: GH3 auxin-responsive promoter family protein [Prevotella sp.]|nr:GH3 auxin-responsive promoter family protein [Bacteroides sp.]MCM1367035.1 GH3 auxin-responsive promoter family protein [Prevotella sp.]MCM1437505.1 GH3 auxin-responsive promoter family protein [Prevotella sp.]